MAINKIMVLGAGTMGMGIAQVFAEAGKTVLVRDIADAFIQRGEGVLKKNLEKKVAKGKIPEEQKNDMLSRVSFTLELADAKDCDLVVEAAIEVLDIKKGIFKELDEICKPETILASNTSSISITAIAAATAPFEKVLGMHFFNPRPRYEAGGSHPRRPHQRRDLPGCLRLRQGDRQEPRRGGRGSRLRGQPHPVPHDQRGHYRSGERHCLQGGH